MPSVNADIFEASDEIRVVKAMLLLVCLWCGSTLPLALISYTSNVKFLQPRQATTFNSSNCGWTNDKLACSAAASSVAC